MPRKKSDFVDVYDKRTGKKRPMKVRRSTAEASRNLSLTPLAKNAAQKALSPDSRRAPVATNPPSPDAPESGAAPTSGDDKSQKE